MILYSKYYCEKKFEPPTNFFKSLHNYYEEPLLEVKRKNGTRSKKRKQSTISWPTTHNDRMEEIQGNARISTRNDTIL